MSDDSSGGRKSKEKRLTYPAKNLKMVALLHRSVFVVPLADEIHSQCTFLGD